MILSAARIYTVFRIHLVFPMLHELAKQIDQRSTSITVKPCPGKMPTQITFDSYRVSKTKRCFKENSPSSCMFDFFVTWADTKIRQKYKTPTRALVWNRIGIFPLDFGSSRFQVRSPIANTELFQNWSTLSGRSYLVEKDARKYGSFGRVWYFI